MPNRARLDTLCAASYRLCAADMFQDSPVQHSMTCNKPNIDCLKDRCSLALCVFENSSVLTYNTSVGAQSNATCRHLTQSCTKERMQLASYVT